MNKNFVYVKSRVNLIWDEVKKCKDGIGKVVKENEKGRLKKQSGLSK